MSKGIPIAYSAADLARYHSGNMSGKERNALEKAALEDPFLADALDGYEYSFSPESEIETLRNRLAKKEEKKRSLPWLQIAAALLLMGLGIWFFNRSSDVSPVAYKNPTPASGSPFTDTSRNVAVQPVPSDLPIAPVSAPTRVTPVDLKPIPSSPWSGDVAAKLKTATTDSASLSSTAIVMEPAPAVATAPMKKEVFFSQQADPGPTARNRALNSVYMDSPFAAQVKDSVVNLNIVLRPLPSADTVQQIVLMKGRRDTVDHYKYLNGLILSDSLQPEEGWAAFDRYIEGVLVQPENPMDEIKKQPHSVILLFDVDSRGQATNIRVEQSDCPSCVDSAIELLKKGPKWKASKKGQTGRLIINF